MHSVRSHNSKSSIMVGVIPPSVPGSIKIQIYFIKYFLTIRSSKNFVGGGVNYKERRRKNQYRVSESQKL